MEDGSSSDGPARRRSSWSLRTIVEDVAGRPIDEFQDPDKPTHPYLAVKPAHAPVATPSEPPYDPVGHLYPPLVGAPGRAYHGAEHEHHPETLERHRPPTPASGERPRPPGPTHRPERLYLHYLLLHMDRLSDTALRYLRAAVEEEVAHRARSGPGDGPVRGAEDRGAARSAEPVPAAPPTP